MKRYTYPFPLNKGAFIDTRLGLGRVGGCASHATCQVLWGEFQDTREDKEATVTAIF